MENINLDLELTAPFGNLYRDRHVLLVVTDKDNKILTGQKPDFYPEGITRFIGGGVENNETFEEAAVREGEEEMGVKIPIESLIKIAEVKLNAKTPKNVFNLTTALFYIHLDTEVVAGDDVKGFSRLTLKELYELVERYETFGEDDVFLEEKYFHKWNDYGKVYGLIHRIAADYIRDNINL